MSAPKAKLPSTGSITVGPIPGSEKCYVVGSRPDIRVPFRRVRQAPSRRGPNGPLVRNPDVLLYDTSGPYTDPE
ncbi:MAG: phosphomethylpyrimidine synthase ThiC, partial [Deltaproteobacteria bacterium]